MEIQNDNEPDLTSLIAVHRKEPVGDNLVARTTEIAGIEQAAYGNPIPASDTVAEMEAKGLFRCSHSGEWLPREAFSPDLRKRNGLQSICKAHHALSERQREVQRYRQAIERYRYRKRKE